MAKNKILVDKETICISIVYFIGVSLAFNLWANNLLTASLLALLWAISVKYWHSKSDNVLFLVGLVAGPLGEINAVHSRKSHYRPTGLNTLAD